MKLNETNRMLPSPPLLHILILQWNFWLNFFFLASRIFMALKFLFEFIFNFSRNSFHKFHKYINVLLNILNQFQAMTKFLRMSDGTKISHLFHTFHLVFCLFLMWSNNNWSFNDFSSQSPILKPRNLSCWVQLWTSFEKLWKFLKQNNDGGGNGIS